ncbi:MAG TPA: sulfatase-like hydrolase/transferase [Polyangia bacterium]|nr:sulfatase-like hydrolase/transferase [Polyangia bacterium]
MQWPTLKRPVAASALAGFVGAGIVDGLLSARGGATGQAFVLAFGLYGAVALAAAFGGALLAAAFDAARPPGWGKLRDEPNRDHAVAAGILAAVVATLVVAAFAAIGQRALVGKMQSQKLATIAAGGMVAIGALPGALAAIAALPALRWIARALPRPRALGATGVLLITLGFGAVLAFVAALSRADWRVLDLGPLYALAVALVLGVAHGVFWFGSATGRAVRQRLPARLGSVLSFAIAIVTFTCLIVGARLPEGSPGFAAAAEDSWGLRLLLGAARRATDHDGDGFSARFGGGDCDDTRADVYPGADDIPGDGIDQNCEGGDAKPSSAPAAAAAATEAPIKAIAPRADAFKGNLLIITIDALRGDRLGVAGYGRPAGHSLTPTLDALARKGTYFKRAWAQAPNTPKSFPVILTGRYPSDIAWDKPGTNYPNLLPSNHTFFETLAAAGLEPIGIFSHFYFTADRGISRGFVEWSDDGAGTIAESNKDIASPRIVPRVIERLRQAAAKKEHFVLWTHLFEPHSSYMPHKEFPTSLSGVPGLMEKYDYEIAFCDSWVGKLIDAVKQLGLADNTAIVVMADHGEAWGEHKVYFHGQDLFDEQLRVPLIFVVPGHAPQVSDEPVALVDVAPTLIDLVGAPIPAAMRGRSLLPIILHGKAAHAAPPHPIFAELLPATAWPHHATMMLDDGHKLIHRISDRRWELYDMRADPGEKKNLADAPADAALLEGLRAKLLAFEERPR